MAFISKARALVGRFVGLPTVGSTAASLPFGGNVIIYSTASAKYHDLQPPSGVGAQVNIFCRRGTTTLTARVRLPSGWSFQRTSNSTGATHRMLTFNAGNQAITLVALSSAKVGLLANTNTVVIGTT